MIKYPIVLLNCFRLIGRLKHFGLSNRERLPNWTEWGWGWQVPVEDLHEKQLGENAPIAVHVIEQLSFMQEIVHQLTQALEMRGLHYEHPLRRLAHR